MPWTSIYGRVSGHRMARMEPFLATPEPLTGERPFLGYFAITDDALYLSAWVRGEVTAPLVPGAPTVSSGAHYYAPFFMRIARARLEVE